MSTLGCGSAKLRAAGGNGGGVGGKIVSSGGFIGVPGFLSH